MKTFIYFFILCGLQLVFLNGFSQTYEWDVSDNSGNSAYPSGNWGDGSNGGSGFNGWLFTQSTGTAGRYIGLTGLSSSSFGIYSDGNGEYSTAKRPFEKTLKSGDTFTVEIGHSNTIDGEIGLTLLDGSSGVITLKFVGGTSFWKFNDGGSDFDIGQGYAANTSLTFSFTYNGGSSYSFSFGSASGNNYTATSNISGIDGVNFYNNNQGSGENFGFDNLAISGSAGSASDVPTYADVEISGNVNLLTTETLTVNNLSIPSVKAGTLTIKSDASGTGSLIVSGSVSGNITAERYIDGHTTDLNGWHHLSSPVGQFAISGSSFEPGSNDDFFSWNEANAIWYNYKQQPEGPDNIDPGTGYLVAYENTSTKTFSGTINNADITINNLSYTANDFQGWHLLGNPFPCALKWDATSWNLSNVSGTAKIWDEGNASYTDISKNGIIPAMQGFMIRVENSTNSITIPTADRTHSSTAWYKNEELNKLKLTVYDLEGGTAQQSVLKFNQSATEGYDSEFDSYYLSGYAPQFYSATDGKPVSTNTLPELNEELQIPYYFIKNASSSYRLEIEGIESLELDSPVYLTDIKANQTINLSEMGYYEFAAEEGDEISRFLLHFKSTGIADDFSQPNPQIQLQNNNLRISNLPAGAGNIRVMDITGRVVSTESYRNAEEISIPLRFKTGIYIVEVTSENGRNVSKIYIK